MPRCDSDALLSATGPLARGHVRALLDALPAEGRAALMSICHVAEVPGGSVVLAEGAASQELGYLLEGALAMQKRLADGRRHIIGILVPTDMFGRLFDGDSAYDIVALTDCRILGFRRDRFEEILGRFPDIERLFLVSVLDELDSAREWVLLMGARRIVERVASFLLILLRRKLRTAHAAPAGERPAPDQAAPILPALRPQSPLEIRIPIRREDLAHYLGTTSETISRILHDLENENVIRLKTPYDIQILNPPQLVRISGAEHLVTEPKTDAN